MGVQVAWLWQGSLKQSLMGSVSRLLYAAAWYVRVEWVPELWDLDSHLTRIQNDSQLHFTPLRH